MAYENICLKCTHDLNKEGVCPKCGWIRNYEPLEAYELTPGTILNGRYLLGIGIKSGGFGIIYHGYDVNLKIHVAIKEFYPQGIVSRAPKENQIIVFSGSKQQQFKAHLSRFLEEGRILAKFSTHPNIVKVYDFFEANGTAYLIMEYLDGVSLKDYLSFNPKLPYEDAISLLLPVMDALDALHKEKIIHRDVNPSNIHITMDNQVKLLDLGAARLSNEESEDNLTVIITPHYAPEEQYQKNGKQGTYTDVYSLAATLYRMVTGIIPDESSDRMVNDQLLKPSVIDPSIPKEIESIILRGMAPEAKLRFKTIKEFKDALLENKVVKLPEEVAKTRKIFRIGIVSSVMAVLIGVFGVYIYNYQNASETALDASLIEHEEVLVAVPKDREDVEVIFKEIEKSFESNYQNIDVIIQFIELEDYQSEIESKKYNVYRSDIVQNGDKADLSDLYASLNSKNYVMFENGKSKLLEMGVLPTSFHGPTLYLNKYLAVQLAEISSSELTFEEFYELRNSYPGLEGFEHLYISESQYIQLSYSEGVKSIEYNEQMKNSLEVMTDLNNELSDDGKAKEALIGNKLLSYLGSTKDYRYILQNMGGNYIVDAPLVKEGLVVDVDDTWSMISADDNKELASMVFMSPKVKS